MGAIADVEPFDYPHVLAGKSVGSRIGCHLAIEEPVAAVCFG